MTASIVYITVRSKQEALYIGRTLVEQRLVACVNIVENISSLYWWDGKVNEETETLLFAKTRSILVPQIIERVQKEHSYDCPCIISWPIEQASEDYLNWIINETS